MDLNALDIRHRTVWLSVGMVMVFQDLNPYSLFTFIIEFSPEVLSFLPELTFDQNWYNSVISFTSTVLTLVIFLCLL